MSRTIAIGDIHGCAAALDAVLDAVGPEPTDLVVTLGDYINRGPDSRGVLDRLIALGRRCRLVPILGNHDQALLDVLSDEIEASYFLSMGGRSTLASYGLGTSSLHRDEFPANHIAWFEACAGFLETDDHIFTHASYLAYLPMIGQPSYVLRWTSLREEIPPPHQSSKRVVLGHTSQKDGKILDLGHLTCIDTYCYGSGWLTALEIYSGKVWQADRHGRLRPDPPQLVPWGS